MDALVLNSPGDRVYLAARSASGPGLTWIQFERADGTLSCTNDPGTELSPPLCDLEHRSVDRTIATGLGLTVPSDPVAIAVVPANADPTGADLGDFIVMAHRNAQATLFLDERMGQPKHLHTLAGLPNDIVSIEADPDRFVWLTSAAVTLQRTTREIVALQIDAPTVGSAQLSIHRRLVLRGVDDGLETRDIVFEPRDPVTDEWSRMWVISRRPESVITVDFDLMPFGFGDVPLGPVHWLPFGPSRIERTTVAGRTALLTTSYDARTLAVVDPDLGPIAIVPGMSGPFEMAIDHVSHRVYVVDFRFSVIWVIDLEPMERGDPPILLARLGSGHAPSVFR
jgi:hypothetical protein